MPLDQNLLRRLLATFKSEAQEHIQSITAGLLELEKAATEPTQGATLDGVFRCAHSLKGAARTVNASDIESLCQSMENVFAAMKRGEVGRSPELFDLLHKVTSALATLLPLTGVSEGGQKPPVAALSKALQGVLVGKREEAAPQRSKSQESPPSDAGPETDQRRTSSDTVRVATSKLDAVLFQAEELVSAKMAAQHNAVKLRQLRSASSEWKRRWARLSPEIRGLQEDVKRKRAANGGNLDSPALNHVAEFLEWNKDFVHNLDAELDTLSRLARRDQHALGGMVDNLLSEMQRVVMQPFSTLLDVFPAFVRELSRQQGKEVDLGVRGAEVEIDRRILEELKDPLVHLVRNCLDHGIETPAVRAEANKPRRATISIAIAARNGSKVELHVSDDGAGIDPDRLKAAAVRAGVLSPERVEALSANEAIQLVFKSGVSTSAKVTDISGRGLGLAIAREKVESLNGTLDIRTKPGEGVEFRIVLPLTLARFRGVIVRVAEHLFVVPTSHVERAIRIKRELIKTVGNRATIELNGSATALVRLGDALRLERSASRMEPEIHPAIVLSSDNQRIAFQVDEVMGEQEVLMKPLGKQLARVQGIAGATVLANGKVVPILNVPDLMLSAATISVRGGASQTSSSVLASPKKSILVAEDSITSRTFLKNILETAGFNVETAVDGVDAFTKLRSGEFALVVSDVDMPRLNGFGLTSKVRADQKLAATPVVLVTALDSREDREHGIDVGANAYIVKSGFEQDNLLDVVRRLI